MHNYYQIVIKHSTGTHVVSWKRKKMSGRHGQQIHKSGPLKQRNKSHKNGRHKSKGEISAAYKGAKTSGCAVV